jgi:predicted esterase
MSFYYGMQAKNIPAGVISLSGYMLKSTPLTNHKKFPVCLMHGQDDQVIN